MFDYCLDMVKSSGGEESIPQEPPTIVRIESHQEEDGSNTYRISVEGVDGKGQKYKSDFMVFGDWQNPGRLKSPNSVYWSGYSFGWPINGDAIVTSTPES